MNKIISILLTIILLSIPVSLANTLERTSIDNKEIVEDVKEESQIENNNWAYNYTYIYDNSDILVARINPDGSKWYYHADHLGSTTLITNQSGEVVENT